MDDEFPFISILNYVEIVWMIVTWYEVWCKHSHFQGGNTMLRCFRLCIELGICEGYILTLLILELHGGKLSSGESRGRFLWPSMQCEKELV